MRTFAILLLSCAALAADDEAADLFYRAFWLEQAAGNRDEAEALYREVLEKHRGAPEAPRALLGLVRIRAARGEPAKELADLLAREYPDAREEIAEARRWGGVPPGEFDPARLPGDSPTDEMVKEFVESSLKEGAAEEEILQMADLGAAAHPMLAYALRSPNARLVKDASQVAAMQRTKESFALLEKALRDPATPLRPTIIRSLAGFGGSLPAEVVDALVEIGGSADPALLRNVVDVVGEVAARNVDLRERACAFLAGALRHPDAEVREAALNPFKGWLDRASPAFIDAALDRYEAGEFPNLESQIPRLANSVAHAARVERLLMESRPFAIPGDLTEGGRALLARVAARRCAAERAGWEVVLVNVLRGSEAATVELLSVALETGDYRLVDLAAAGASPAGEAARNLRHQAIRAAFGPRPGSVYRFLSKHPLEAADADLLFETLRADEGRELTLPVTGRLLAAIGPERAAALAGHVRRATVVRDFLLAATELGPDAQPVFEELIPKAVPGEGFTLGGVAKVSPQAAALVASRLLQGREPEWVWGGRRADGECAASLLELRAVRDALRRTPLLESFLGCVADDRVELASLAVATAASLRNEAGDRALVAALGSAHVEIRKAAYRALRDRPSAAPALLERFDELSAGEGRDAYFGVLGELGGEAVSKRLREFLAKRPADSGLPWNALAQCDPAAAAELALAVAFGGGPAEYRREALTTLTRVGDPRRIAHFRAVLTDFNHPGILEIVTTVGEQYLVELGNETLELMRHPDPSVREAAAAAVERLKFFLEARRALDRK